MTSHLEGKEQLKALFVERGLPQVVQDYFLIASMHDNLDDFLDSFQKATFETEIQAVIENRFKVTEDGPPENRISVELQRKLVARTRTTYAAALALREKTSQSSDVADVDSPLGKEDLEQIDKSWKALNPWRPIPSIRACTQLLGRVFREINSKKFVLHPVELAISMEVDKCVQETAPEPVGPLASPGHPQLLVRHAKQPRRRVITTTLEYISALRVLFFCYAYVGSFTVERPAKDGKSIMYIPFMPWGDALAYCDHCMNMAIIMGRRLCNEQALISWLRRRDEMIRADMAHRINDLELRPTAAEALSSAMAEHKHMWMLKDGQHAEYFGEDQANALTEQLEGYAGSNSQTQQRGQKRPRDIPAKGDGKEGWPRRHPNGKWICQYKSGDASFAKICPKWNEGTCNKKAACSLGKHCCAVVVANGRPCQKNHTALVHR